MPQDSAKDRDGTSTVEIERKFLVPRLPENLDAHRCEAMEQGYLATQGTTVTVRVRRQGGSRVLTVKQGGGMARTEVEVPISEAQYEALWLLTEGRRLSKTRYYVPHQRWTIEVDVYDGPLEGLFTAEVEFDDEAEVDLFEAPSWLGREVTMDRRYKNFSLAMYGCPEENTDG